METNESRGLGGEGEKKEKIAKEEPRERGGEWERKKKKEEEEGGREGRKDSRVRMEMKKNC